MGAATAALIGTTLVSATASISQGYATQSEANFNASLFENKARLVDVQKDIEAEQYDRLKNRIVGKSVVNIAQAGIMPTGSAMAALVGTLTQVNIDKAIGQFNLEMEKGFTLAQAGAEKRRGRSAVYAGYTDAFSTLLKGGYKYGKYQGFGKKKTKGEE